MRQIHFRYSGHASSWSRKYLESLRFSLSLGKFQSNYDLVQKFVQRVLFNDAHLVGFYQPCGQKRYFPEAVE